MWCDVGGYCTNICGVEDWDFWVVLGVKGYYGKKVLKLLFFYCLYDGGFYKEVLVDSDWYCA